MSPIVMKTSSLATLLIFVIAVATVSAQTPPEAPQPDRDSYGLGTDCAYENFFAGPSFTAGDSIGGPTFTGGVTIGQYFARTLGKGITPPRSLSLASLVRCPAARQSMVSPAST